MAYPAPNYCVERHTAGRYLDRAQMLLADYRPRPEAPGYLLLAAREIWVAAGLDPDAAADDLARMLGAVADAGGQLLLIAPRSRS